MGQTSICFISLFRSFIYNSMQESSMTNLTKKKEFTYFGSSWVSHPAHNSFLPKPQDESGTHIYSWMEQLNFTWEMSALITLLLIQFEVYQCSKACDWRKQRHLLFFQGRQLMASQGSTTVISSEADEDAVVRLIPLMGNRSFQIRNKSSEVFLLPRLKVGTWLILGLGSKWQSAMILTISLSSVPTCWDEYGH